jgi:hypothetical protein
MSHHSACAPATTAALRLPLLARLGLWANPRSPRLDPQSLSGHMQRDLGFATGRISRQRDLLRD